MSLQRRNEDRLGVRREAEPTAHRGTASGHSVTVAVTPGLVAEADVLRGGHAHGARGVEARRSPSVDGASPAADVPDALRAEGDRGRLGGALGEGVDGLSDEGELGVGGGEEVRHLGLGDDGGRSLDVGGGLRVRRMSVSEKLNAGERLDSLQQGSR